MHAAAYVEPDVGHVLYRFLSRSAVLDVPTMLVDPLDNPPYCGQNVLHSAHPLMCQGQHGLAKLIKKSGSIQQGVMLDQPLSLVG
jgi:hypothetical protein